MAARKRDDDDDDDLDDDDKKSSRVKKGPPQKKVRARDRARDDDDEDDEEDSPKGKKPQKKVSVAAKVDDDEDEDAGQEKKGLSPMVWVGGGGAVVLVLLAVLFFVMRGGSNNEAEIAENPQQQDTNKAPENKPPDNKNDIPDPMPDPKKDPAEPTKDPKEEVKKEDPKEPIKPNDPPDPVPMPVSVSGEKVYQRLLKSTAWILAPQARPMVVKIPVPNPAVPPPMGSPIGTVWVGKEKESASELKLQFITIDRVLMFDKDSFQLGTYQVADTNINFTFPTLTTTYAGTIKDDMMTGSAKDAGDNWNWELAKQMPQAPLMGDVAIKSTLSGSGVLVDGKHRLVIANGHVVGDPDNVVVHFPTLEKGEMQVQKDFYKKSTGFKGKVVLRDDRCDLALIQVESYPASIRPLPMSRASAKTAQNVHSLGNPGVSRTLWIYAPGRVRQVFRDDWKITDEMQNKTQSFAGMKIETDAPINRGDHGGPLVNDQSVLVGVNTGAAGESISHFVDVSECRALVLKYYKSINETWVPEPEPVNEVVVAKLPDLLRKLDRQDLDSRLVAAQILTGMGSEATPAYQSVLAALRKEDNAAVRSALEDAVEKIPPRPGDLDLLVDICKDNQLSTRLRQQALRGMIRLGVSAKPATPVLFELIKDSDLELQRLSLAAIAAAGPESKDVPQLAPMLKSTNLGVSRQAVDTIGKIGSDAKATVPQLLILLKKNDKLLKERVLLALQNIGPVAQKDASPALHEMLKDPNPELGGQVAVTLARIGDTKTAVPYLITKVKSGGVPQRRATIKLLASLGPEARTATTELLGALDEDALHEDAKDALIKIGKDATVSICKKMPANLNSKTRLACVHILGEIRYNRVYILEALRIIANADPVPDNRAAALKTMEKLMGGT